MGKSFTKATKPSKAESKAVKAGGITKPSKSSKAKSKETAKATAKNIEKKKKKVVEPESSDSESESDNETDASESDSDVSEEEAPKKANGKKAVTNGKKATAKDSKAKAAESSDSESGSGSGSDSDDSEEETAGTKVNGKKAAESADDSESDSDSDDETEEKAVVEANGTKKADSDSDEDSDDSNDSGSGSDSDEEEEEEKTKTEAPSKKRKAEDNIDDAAKKTKADADAAPTLFAGSLSWGVDDDALYEAFKSCDGLVGARVVTDKLSGRSRGFGYVDFSDSDSAKKAFEAMQGQEIDGRALNLDFANAKSADSNPRDRAADRAKRHGDSLSTESDTLFVGNLPFDVEQETVREFFSDVAEVVSVRLPTDPDSGNLKGFGYVTFSSVEDAKNVLQAKVGASIGNGRMARSVRLDFAGSRPPRDNSGGGGRGGFGGRGGRGGGRGGPRGGGRGGFGGRGGGRGGSRGGFSGTKTSFD